MTELTTEQQNEIASAEKYLNDAKNFVINDIHSFKKATVMLQSIKLKKKEYDDLRKKLKAPILLAGKNIEEMFRKPLHFLYQAETEFKKNILNYELEQRKKEDEEQKAKAELEKELETEAEIAHAKGNVERFNNTIAQIKSLQTEVVEKEKVEGINIRENWQGEVSDIKELLNAIIAGKAPLNLISVNQSALNQLAKSTKGTMLYPGVRFFNRPIIAAKA